MCQVGERVAEPDHESEAVEWFDLKNLPNSSEIAFDHEEIIRSFIDDRE